MKNHKQLICPPSSISARNGGGHRSPLTLRGKGMSFKMNRNENLRGSK
jgi:hypothetical protein